MVSFGFALTALITIPMGYFNLDDNMSAAAAALHRPCCPPRTALLFPPNNRRTLAVQRFAPRVP